MDQPANIETDCLRGRLDPRLTDLLAVGLVLVTYTATLWVARNSTFLEAARGGVANTLPLVIFGALARKIILTRLTGRSLAVQMAGHALLAAAFSLLAYWLLMVLLGLIEGVSATEFDVRPFPNRAMAWQMLQNLTTYGLVATLSHLQARPDPVTVILSDTLASGERGEGLSRYFIRSGEDIRPVDVDAIVSIAGADDYAEVITLEGRHLVRMTLAELEKSLDGRKFIRVHRSRIVNVERILRAEPAGGGRMLLHMEDGEMISASRAGTRLLRDRVL
jgi:hypothetical protein